MSTGLCQWLVSTDKFVKLLLILPNHTIDCKTARLLTVPSLWLDTMTGQWISATFSTVFFSFWPAITRYGHRRLLSANMTFTHFYLFYLDTENGERLTWHSSIFILLSQASTLYVLNETCFSLCSYTCFRLHTKVLIFKSVRFLLAILCHRLPCGFVYCWQEKICSCVITLVAGEKYPALFILIAGDKL